MPIYPLAPNTAPLQRGPWRPGQEGRSLQPGQGGRLVASGLEPGVVLLILQTLVSFFVPPSPPLITRIPTGGTEAFSVFSLVTVFVLCCASRWMVSVSPRWGKRKTETLLPVISSAVPHRTSESSLWASLGSCLGPPGGGPRGAGPCGWRGSLIGEGWRKGCPAGWDPPHLCARGRGLSCLGFSEGRRQESLNGETNKTPSLTLLSVRS